MSSLMILHQVKYGNLVALPLTQPSASRPVGIITRVGRSVSPAAQQFIKTLLTEAPRLIRTASSQAEIRHRVLFEQATLQISISNFGAKITNMSFLMPAIR